MEEGNNVYRGNGSLGAEAGGLGSPEPGAERQAELAAEVQRQPRGRTPAPFAQCGRSLSVWMKMEAFSQGSVTPSVNVTRSHVPHSVLTTSLLQGGTVPVGEHKCLVDSSGPQVKTSKWGLGGIFCAAL